MTACFPFPFKGGELETAVFRGVYDKQHPRYTRLSNEAKDFIDRFLQRDPQNRISLEDVAATSLADS